MKRFLSLILGITLMAAGLLSIPRVSAAESNLIPNPSVEEAANPTTPQSWVSNNWGTNTASFEYLNEGHTGSRSVKTEITSYTDGDAKWFFTPVSITPDTSYQFSDYYKSDVSTEVVVQFTHNDNSNSYQWLGSASASSTEWNQFVNTFTAPATAQKASIFHVLPSVGWLIVDDADLSEYVLPEPEPTENMVINPSLETSSNNLPSNWLSNKWGTNTASFEYLNEGHTGSRSVKTEITSYTDGDAKWYFNQVDIAPNSSYEYKDYYKSNVSTNVFVWFTHTDGSNTYEWLGSISASPDAWQPASFSFSTPSSVEKVSIFHIVSSVGWLIVDDAELGEVTLPEPPVGGNLIPNPSVEEAANPTTPQSWVSNNWGTNTASFEYLNEGHTGSRSVKTEITSYTDGDAKWFFTPVSITPDTSYQFSDYYKSDVSTEVVVQFTHNDNSNSYQWLGSASASSTEWNQFVNTFTAPATAQKASIFHVLPSVGWLIVDDADLSEEGAEEPPVDGAIPNPSLETVSAGNSNLPDQWGQSNWGTNTASFEYLNEGHTGSRSVKVTLSDYVDGDAKWYFEPIGLDRGGSYRFSAWYKTDTTPSVVVAYEKDNGSMYYAGLPKAYFDPNSNTGEWKLYDESFIVPADAKSMTMYFLISGNGWLQVDDYELGPYEPTGFNRPLVTLTFDDGHEDNVDTALPIMNQLGIKSTQCYATDHVEGLPEETQNVLDFYISGHEICSHTVSHPFLTQLTAEDLQYELSHSQEVLEGVIGEPVRNFATPFGDYDFATNEVIKQYYDSHRTVDEGYNSKDNFDAYRLRVQNMLSTTTLAEYQNWLDYAEATNTWLILVYHRVADDPGPFDTLTSDFEAQMTALQASGLTVKTYSDALDELIPQL